MLCKAFPYHCHQIIHTYIYIHVYIYNVFSTSTSCLLCFGRRFHDVHHNVITVINGTLDQTFGANTSWIRRTSLKQFGIWGDILKRLLPIHIYKHASNHYQETLLHCHFSLPPPLQNRLIRLSPSSPATKPMSLTTAVPCYKPQGSQVDHLAGQSMIIHQPGNQWKLRGFLISPYLN